MTAFTPSDDEFARQHRQAVIETAKVMIVNQAITEPVRLEFSRLPNDDDFCGITKVTANIWLIAPEPGKKRTGNIKVERHVKGGDTGWTCSHQGWDPKEQCKHISRVRFMIGDTGAVPYDGRRRRPLTKWLYPKGEPTEDTRRNRARATEPWKVPQLAYELCKRFVRQPDRRETKSKAGGASGAPIPVRVFALLMKVFANVSYEHLRHRLAENGLIWELGFLKKRPPGKTSYSAWFGEPELTPILRQIFEETKKPARRIDSMLLGDSHDMPTRVLVNSRDEKFGKRRLSWRKERPLIRQHFLVGKISNIIVAADTTLTRGIGSGDGPHFPGMLVEALQTSESVDKAALDKAYSIKRNFAAAEALDVDLFVREDGGENRLLPHWPKSAQRLTKLEREDPTRYTETSRFRSKAEGTPSRIKARNPGVRLRRRKNDPAPLPLPPGVKEDSEISSLPEDVISAIMDVATSRVGPARLNESLAILIVANLRALNVLEHLLGQTVTFEDDITLNPPMDVSERDVA